MKKIHLLLLLIAATIFSRPVLAQTNPGNPQNVCFGYVGGYQVDYTDPVGGLDGTPGSTYTWNIAPNTPITVTPFVGAITPDQSPGGFNNRVIIDWGATLPGSYIVTVQETTNGCAGPAVTLEVVISYLNATVASTTPVCNGDDAVFTFTGPANGTIDITVNGTPQTITLDASGNGSFTVTGATVDQTVNLVTVNSGTCSNPVSGSSTVVVNPLLNVSVSGATPICSGDNAVFSFSGGPANGTVDISVNGTPQTVTLDASGNGTYTVNGATLDQTVNLVTVSDGTCSNTVSGTSTITISPLLTVSLTANSPICNAGNAVFNFSAGPANGSVDITVNGTPQTVTLDASGNGSYTASGVTVDQIVNIVTVSTGTCSNPVTGTATVVVNPLLTLNVSSVSPICNGADAVFSFSGGPANGTVDITVNGSPQTVTLDASGNGTYTVTGATVDQTVNLVTVSDGTCSNTVSGTSTVVVSPLLTVSLTSTSPICNGANAVFSFTGGPANGTVDITVNGTPQTVTLDASGNGTYTVSGATNDQTLNLVTVSDGTCSNSVSGTSTVVVNPLLTVSVSGASPICSGDNAVFSFSGGPANGTVDITVNGTPQTVTLDGSGNGTYTVTGATLDQTVNLVTVSDGTCSNTVVGTATITISPLLTVNMTAVSPICNGADAIFTFTGGPANGTVDITVNGTPQTVTLDASGNGSFTVTGATTNQTVNLVSVASGSCSNTVTGTSTVVVNPLLSVSMTASSPVCNGADAIFNFTSGPSNGTVNITVNGSPQTVTLDASGNGTFTVTGATADQTAVLVDVSDGTCSNTVTGTVTVVVNPLLSVSVSAPSPICSGDDAIFNFSAGPANGTVNITVNGTPQTVTLDGLGNGTYTVTGATSDQTVNLVTVSDGTCSNTVTGTATVVVNTLLSATVTPVTPVCAGSDAVFNFTGPANGTIDITVNGTPQTVTLDASGNGTYTVTGANADQTVNLVAVGNGSCSNPTAGTVTVVVNPIPTTSPIFHD